MSATLRKGWGYHDGEGRFHRTSMDMVVRVAPEEYAKPGHVIVYTDAGTRLHVDRRALTGYAAIVKAGGAR